LFGETGCSGRRGVGLGRERLIDFGDGFLKGRFLTGGDIVERESE
jgi:hypothetical protein